MKVRNISYPELEIACREIKDYAEKEKPDWIIPIYNGGGKILKLSGLDSWNTHKVFITHREIGSWFGKIIKKMPTVIRDLLRNIDIVRPRSKKRDSYYGNIQRVSGKVLIIDDAIDRGITLEYLLTKLEEVGVKKDNIKVAVINDIRGKGPGFSIYKNIIIRFPWNLDY